MSAPVPELFAHADPWTEDPPELEVLEAINVRIGQIAVSLGLAAPAAATRPSS